MKNSMVADKFALGKCAKGSNFVSDGDTCTSYSTDIAVRTKGAVLVASCYEHCGSYGTTPSTERQISYIVRACSRHGIPCYEVPNIAPMGQAGHLKNFDYLMGVADDLETKADKARIYGSSYRLQAEQAREKAYNYHTTFCE